jgi:hypothetical protein
VAPTGATVIMKKHAAPTSPRCSCSCRSCTSGAICCWFGPTGSGFRGRTAEATFRPTNMTPRPGPRASTGRWNNLTGAPGRDNGQGGSSRRGKHFKRFALWVFACRACWSLEIRPRQKDRGRKTSSSFCCSLSLCLLGFCGAQRLGQLPGASHRSALRYRACANTRYER